MPLLMRVIAYFDGSYTCAWLSVGFEVELVFSAALTSFTHPNVQSNAVAIAAWLVVQDAETGHIYFEDYVASLTVDA